MAAPAVPAPSDPTAVVGRRVVAALIDFALLIIPALLLLTASFEYLDEADLGARDGQAFCDDYMDQEGGLCADLTDVNDRVYFSDGTDGASALVFWGGSIVLLVVLQGLTGRTPGKLVTGLRTVREDGSVPGLVKALLRWLLLIVDALPCIPLVGFICALTTRGHRRVGDMAAKTFVVRSSFAGAPIALPGSAPVPGSPAWGAPASIQAPSVPSQAPQWDQARGTYIQWDPALGQWMQWDEATRTWSPIPGQ